MFVRINHSHQIRACNSWRCKHKKSCPRKYHSVSRSLLIEEKNWVKDKKFPLQATFTSPSEPQNYQVQPEITNTGRIKAGHCPFSCSQLPFNYGWFSSLRPSLPRSLLSLLSSPFSWSLILLSLSPGRYCPSEHLQRQRLFLHLSCMKSFNGVNQWENNGAARWGSI